MAYSLFQARQTVRTINPVRIDSMEEKGELDDNTVLTEYSEVGSRSVEEVQESVQLEQEERGVLLRWATLRRWIRKVSHRILRG